MKKCFYFIVIIFTQLFFIYSLNAQSLEETLDYINKQVNLDANKFGYGKSAPNIEDIWSVSSDGELSIKHYWQKQLSKEQKVYLKSLYPIKCFVPYDTGSFRQLYFYCNGTHDCLTDHFLKDDRSEDKITYEDGIKLNLPGDSILVNHLKNAITHLINIAHAENSFKNSDPFSTDSREDYGTSINTPSTDSQNVIHMTKMASGLFEIPVTINDVLKISFIFDSGASDVSIAPDVALTLIRTGTVRETDFIGSQKYSFADGSTATSRRFIIRKLSIGNHVVTNVTASISNSVNAPMLLGQSVQERFGKITIDNNNHTLTFGK